MEPPLKQKQLCSVSLWMSSSSLSFEESNIVRPPSSTSLVASLSHPPSSRSPTKNSSSGDHEVSIAFSNTESACYTGTMRAGEELLCGYKERVRARLQELMVGEGIMPSHPLVTSTSLHLNLSTASEVAANFGAPLNAVSYYQGCDLFYRVPHRSATPLSEFEDSLLSDLKQAA